MLYAKDSPAGIDVPLQRLQNLLYTRLPETWGIPESMYACYGRVYRNQKDGGYVPEAYTGKGGYRDVFHDDRVHALSFFGVDDRQKYDAGMFEAGVYLVFCVNLEKLKPDVKHRADEEVRRDVIRLLQDEMTDITASVTGIASVFAGFDIKRINYRDMHPHHCFRINFNLLYEDECS